MKIILNMIVKNEEAIIRRCIESCHPYIHGVALVDTGSTDNTIGVLNSYRESSLRPMLVDSRQWENFAVARTQAIDLAVQLAAREGWLLNECYALIMDADHELVSTSHLPFNGLTEGVGLVMHRYEGTSYYKPVLLRLDLQWRWEGVVHETPVSQSGFERRNIQPTETFVRVNTDGARAKDPERYAKDAQMILADMEARPEEKSNPRAIFYLAESYRWAADDKNAVLWYWQRSTMEGWDEEAWYATWQYAEAIARLRRWNPTVDTPDVAFIRAINKRPHRNEAYMGFCAYLRDQKLFHVAMVFAREATKNKMPSDLLFVREEDYWWRPWDELLISAWWAGKKDVAQEAAYMLTVKNGWGSTPHAARVRDNILLAQT